MADESSELVGGISVDLGANHRGVERGIDEANAMLQEWAKQNFTVQLNAQFSGGQGGRAAKAPSGPDLSFGPSAAGKAQAKESASLQAAITAELAKQGKQINATTGEVEDMVAGLTKTRREAEGVASTLGNIEIPSIAVPVSLDQETVTKALQMMAKMATEAEAAGKVTIPIETEKPATVNAAVEKAAAQATSHRTSSFNYGGRPMSGDMLRMLREQNPDDPAFAESSEDFGEGGGGGGRAWTTGFRGGSPKGFTYGNTQTLPINFIDQLEKQRRTAAGPGLQSIDINRSEQSLARQRAREEAAATRAQQAEEKRLARERAQGLDAEQNRLRAIGRQVAPQKPLASTALREAGAVVSGGRAQTQIAGLFSLALGGRREAFRAEQEYRDARREATAADKAAAPVIEQLEGIQHELTVETDTGRKAELRARQDRLANDPKTIELLRRREEATIRLGKAEENLSKLSGAPSAIRSLAAVTVGGAAFATGMQAINFAIDAAAPALGAMIDQMTGFGAISTRVTSDLAKQTLALNGNVDASFAQAAVTARLSASTADYLGQQLKLTTSIKTGALAQQQTSDLFRAGLNTGQRGVPQGLGGGFGGLFGGPLLAEQLGGGKGFQEILAGDVRALQTNRKQQSPGEFLTDMIGDITGSLNPFGQNFNDPRKFREQRERAEALSGSTPELTKYIDDLNAAMGRTARVTGQAAKSQFAYTNNQDEINQAISIAKTNGDDLGASLAQMGFVIKNADGSIASFTEQIDALAQAATGKGIPAIEELGRLATAQEQERQRQSRASLDAIRSRQAFERPATINAINRQASYALNVQQPAQQALQNLANPLQPVGTGQVAANAKEQAHLNKEQQRSVELQKELNTYYAEGRKVLIDTYHIPAQLIDEVGSVGKEIASVQAGIRNEQAAYQVAQYNFQLQIAKRSLADIGGLTGKNFGAGQSYLGQLERENLALSRQGQLLQFNLTQRQINFRVAVAGFQAPGVTPEERQANVKEAQLEASYAQKQLNIQKEMFGNQVQIVDIQNLRQGADLARQIGLLLQGRQVTIDTAAAQERLQLLQEKQQILVTKVGTYMTRIDSLAVAAMGEITTLEAAAGQAMNRAAVQSISSLYGFLNEATDAWNEAFNGGNKKYDNRNDSREGTFGGAHASGFLGTVSGATNMIMGEAGAETVAILRNPRSVAGGGGGGDVTITFGDVYVRSEEDIQKLARAVVKEMGRNASAIGLRSVG